MEGSGLVYGLARLWGNRWRLGKGIGIEETDMRIMYLKALTYPSNPWDPFTNTTEFRLAEIMTTHEANQGLIDDLLKDDSGLQLLIKQSLKSTYILK
jgi:hypothetical protein